MKQQTKNLFIFGVILFLLNSMIAQDTKAQQWYPARLFTSVAVKKLPDEPVVKLPEKLLKETVSPRGDYSFKPLLREDTYDMIYVRVDSLDINAFIRDEVKLISEFSEIVCLDKTQANRHKMSLLYSFLEMYQNKAIFVDYLKKAKIKEVYMIGSEKYPDILSAFIAVPIDRQSQSQISTIRNMIKELKYPYIRPVFVGHGHIIAPIFRTEQSVEMMTQFIQREFKELKTAAKPKIIEALDLYPDAEYHYVMIDPKIFVSQMSKLSIFTSFTDAKANDKVLSEKIDKVYKEELLPVINKLEYATQIFEQSDMTCIFHVEMKNNQDAASFSTVFRKFVALNVDRIIGDVKSSLVRDTNLDELKSVADKIAEVLYPKVEGKSLRWEFSRQTLEDVKPHFDKLKTLFTQLRQSNTKQMEKTEKLLDESLRKDEK